MENTTTSRSSANAIRLWNEGHLAGYHGVMNGSLTHEMFTLDEELRKLGKRIDKRHGPWGNVK